MDVPGWSLALLAAAALHAGFQLTVTAVVYPALAAVPAAGWRPAHDAHSRRIVPLVGLAYGASLLAGVGAALAHPSAGTWVAVVGTVAAVAVTAVSAAPTHSRLGPGKDDALVRRLLAADRVRAAAATLALAGAVAAVL